MIKSIYIRNYAIIDELEIQFPKGLTIITGETGAGKSILLGALGLIMGKRADIKSLHNLEKKCVIEGHFDVGQYDLKRFFESNDIDYDTEVVVRREITPSGKSRSFINDTPTNLKVLQQLSSALIDLHQQFDTLDIHQVSFQLQVLDALAGNKQLLVDYRNVFREYQGNRRRLKVLVEADQNATKENDYLQFQLDELLEVSLEKGEQETLEAELAQLTNAEDIKRILSGAYLQLSEAEQSVIAQLEEIVLSVGNVKNFHAELGSLHQRFQGILYELQDVSSDFERISDSTQHNPERAEEVQARLDSIYRLQSKHQVQGIDELLAIQHQLEQQLQSHSNLSEEIEALKIIIGQQRELLMELADELSEKRKSVVADFQMRVLDRLQLLSMEHAQLEVNIAKLEELSATGYDDVHFLFAANMGSRLQLIKEVASGGELSRLTLVIKSLVARAIPLPTLIFDEIDTGISGDVALKMGSILRDLSNHHQVVSITHSPQIASKADAHYFVYKQVKEDRTFTQVKGLRMDERIHAIATMLSHDPPSESAIENAKELLKVS
jgi:DNA repair protein RecN (Recombination protein N)